MTAFYPFCVLTEHVVLWVLDQENKDHGYAPFRIYAFNMRYQTIYWI